MACPASCSNVTQITIPPVCTVQVRKKTISRFIFVPCSFQLPSPISQANMQTFFTNGTIALTGKLANVVVNDPTTEDITLDDCSPALKNTLTREITAEDRNTYVVASSPATSPMTANQYYDYLFHLDKINNQSRLALGIVFCDGDVILPRDANGNMLTMSWYDFISYQKSGTVGGASVEFKKISVTWAGDPLYFQQPDFNLGTLGIVY